MKKFYVKTAEGVLVSATPEQIADAKVEKFSMDVPDPVPAPQEDPIKELTGLIKELGGDVKGKVAKMQEELAAYKAAASRGFMAPQSTPEAPPEGNDMEKFLGKDNLAYQGKRLMDKLAHPAHQIEENTRKELAIFWLLFLKGTAGSQQAREKYLEHFGPMLKTPVGDVGNVFPLPDILEAEILAYARESSVILQYARIWPMTSEKQSFPAESAGATVAWGNETVAGDPTITEVEIDANELSSYSTVKNATLMDARSDIVSWLTESMAEAAGLELDNQAFNGSGTPFYGIFNATYGAGYSVVLTGTAFQDVGFADFSSMIAKLDGLKKQGARFWMHGGILHYVRILKDDQNRPIFYETVGSPTSGTILGFPYSEVIKCPSATASNTPFLAFGNLRFVAVGRRLDTATLSVDPYGLWTTNRTRYKLYQRWAMKVALRNGLVRMLTGE